MKKRTIICLAILALAMKADNDRLGSLCQKWVQFASKQHDQPTPKPVTSDMAITYQFKTDNTYEETEYNNMMRMTGKWRFADEQKKLLFVLGTVNGKQMPEFEGKPTTMILKLTADTLILGQEAYYGKDKIYGHDDQFFVKVK